MDLEETKTGRKPKLMKRKRWIQKWISYRIGCKHRRFRRIQQIWVYLSSVVWADFFASISLGVYICKMNLANNCRDFNDVCKAVRMPATYKVFREFREACERMLSLILLTTWFRFLVTGRVVLKVKSWTVLLLFWFR